MSTKNINWFKQEIEPHLSGYGIRYRYYEQGDFGSLTQVIFEGKEKGGQIDYWGLGWLGIFLWDEINELEVINLLFSPDEVDKGDEWLDKLIVELINLVP